MDSSPTHLGAGGVNKSTQPTGSSSSCSSASVSGAWAAMAASRERWEDGRRCPDRRLIASPIR